MLACLVQQKVKVADMFVRTLAVSQGEGYSRTLLEIEHSSGQSRKVMHFWYNTWVSTWIVLS
jgi:hypothetical protein